MKNCATLLAILLLPIASSVEAIARDSSDTRMLTQPAVSETHVAFVYDRDLWIADRDGSNPRRLTSHEGLETSPRFSADGTEIAFTAEYEGNRDVYLMSIKGGLPRRLTFHPAQDIVQGFTPDGDILFASTRDTFTSRFIKLFTVPTSGGFPTPLPIPNGFRASYSEDGKKIAYIPIPERFNQWKNYRGGTATRIWIYDTSDHSVQQIRQPEGRCNDTDPVFFGGRVYFRSDRNGEFNLFMFDPNTEAIEQVTEFQDFPIQQVTQGPDRLIYEQAGYLFLFDPKSKESTRLKIGISTDMTELRARLVSGSEWITQASISPSGARAVFGFRGEVVTVPAAKGDVRNLTATPGVHERWPAWSPDGQSIAYFSDAGGEYQLHIAPQNGKGDIKQYAVEGHGFYGRISWSPNGKLISYVDNSQSLYIFDIERNRSTKIASEPHYRPGALGGLPHDWSPDSKWLAYAVHTKARIQQVHVYDVEKGESHSVTDGMSEVTEPVFDKTGEYLYFIASTDAGPVKHWFAMSNNDMQLTNQIYMVVLSDDAPNPLARESDEEKTVESSSDDDGDSEEEPQEGADVAAENSPPVTTIDFDGLDQRIISIPLPPSVYSNLEAGDGKVFYIQQDREGKRKLANYSLQSRKPMTLLESANSFSLTPDSKKLLYQTGSTWGIAATTAKIPPGTGKLNVDAIQVRMDPAKEWKQIFDEVWRINRDYFYDPNMHGADWPAMRDKYEPLLEHCITRGDLNRLLMWMCSELAVGHHRVGGGDIRPETEFVPGGLLGADYEIHKNRYRIAKVFGGLNWNGDLRAPLTEPGVRLQAGVYILAVNGEELTGKDNIHRLLVNTAGKNVELTVADSPKGDSRVVTVVPIANELRLRNRDWVEGNLRKVNEATEGRVAYVYVPNTTTAGHTYFKRYFFPQTDKQAIIIDERFNGGGQVADYYIDHLRRPYISHWATRYGDDQISPSGAIFGPKVMLIDETAGSGGDLLPWMFNKLKLGQLVGKRTWGGLVGILGYPMLMDGGSVTAPNIAIWTEDGFIVENVGVPPDVEVEQYPADVIAGRDPQLEKAIEIVLEELERNPPKEFKKPPFPIRVRQ